MSELRWGIDLGGTKIECAVVSGRETVARHRIDTESSQGYEHILSRIELLLRHVENMVGQRATRVGIGAPGTRDPKTGLMRGCNTTALNGRLLLDDLQDRLLVEVRIANDANCFALAEARMGAAIGYRTVFGVILGTGVGGGIVVDGQILEGRQGIAGEWGHNPLEVDGEACYCGRIGCVETVLAGPWLEAFYRKLAGASLSLPEIIQEARRAEDMAAIQTVDRLVAMFGKAIGPIVNTLDPEAIVLGGGVGNIDELYSRGAQSAKSHIFNPNPEVNLLRPLLGDSAGVFGAAFL